MTSARMRLQVLFIDPEVNPPVHCYMYKISNLIYNKSKLA